MSVKSLTNFAVIVLLVFVLLRGGDPSPGPGPVPDVDPAPFPSDGLAVLIVYESADKGTYPPSQLNVIDSTTLRKFVKDAGGEIRLFDKDIDAQYEAEKWREALAKPRDSLPWILISHGGKGYSGALPETVDATKELIQKYK